jgi:sugar O-acyltransferase (sialic acid O-acetyltransferase NeuD family)
LGKPIVWIDDLKEFDSYVKAVCAISSMQRHQIIEQVQGFGIEFISYVHPSSRISRSASLGEGVVINSGVQVAVDAALGDFVYVNRGCLVGHDVQVGDYAVLSPGVNIAGNSIIGARTFIGMGAVIADKVKIGERCVVCAGAVVIRDVEDWQKVLGVPARVVE